MCSKCILSELCLQKCEDLRGPKLKYVSTSSQAEILMDTFHSSCDPKKNAHIQGPGGGGGALEESNKYSQIVFIDCSLFLMMG